MGAALSKRVFGDTIEGITDSFPYWFSDNLKKFRGKESELPTDQHMRRQRNRSSALFSPQLPIRKLLGGAPGLILTFKSHLTRQARNGLRLNSSTSAS